MVTRRTGGGSLPSLQRRCLHQQLALIAIVALLFLVIVDSVYGFGSINYQRISQHHHADPKLLLTTSSSSLSSSSPSSESGRMACNNDSPLTINSYSNKQSTSITKLYAKKQPTNNDKNNSEEEDDKNKVMGIFNSKSPGTLLIAPFVILFGLDLILNIAAITRRSLEYVLTGQLPSNTPWGG